MAENYNLQELFQLAFGKKTPVFTTESNASVKADSVFSGVTVKDDEQAQRMSWMGTPILFPVKFKKGSYLRYKPNNDVEEIEKQDFYLPPATLVDFRRAKNIVKTNTRGGFGSVKEIFSYNDWSIRIKGLCLNEPGRTAYDQIEELLSWEAIADSIGVSGKLFIDKGINAIVIESIEVPQVQGKPNVIPFTITAISDQILLFK